MRIISGLARGSKLKVPAKNTRPTMDMVRQAMFSMIGPSIEGAHVLDLFAGCGALGLESLSRGAASAYMVDNSREACAVIKANMLSTGLKGATVRQADAISILTELARTHAGQFDLVFADAPYTHTQDHKDWTTALLNCPHLASVLSPDGMVNIECMASKLSIPLVPGWELVKDRCYGSTRVLWLRPLS
jgi:16S rRNA (guanine966-N2)-methyltransferase